MDTNKTEISWKDFMKVEMRVGTVLSAEQFEEARNPAYKMQIDFGDYGIRKTSAQITALYRPKELIGKQVVAVVNFPPKQIATIMSECLVLGAIDDKEVTLIGPGTRLKNGLRIG